MKRISGLVLTGVTSVALVGALAAPANAAGPVVHTANYTGGFTTSCDLPYSPDGASISGDYTCHHNATSIACAAVSSSSTSPTPLCTANLTSGTTTGYATGTEPYTTTQQWACWTHYAGWGTFHYQPSPTDDAMDFDVSLVTDTITRQILITGSRYDGNSGGLITVRATIPAYCTPYVTAAEGFQGSVSPV